MRNFVTQAYYSYRGLFSWLPWPSYISTVVLGPVFSIIMFVLVGRFALGPKVVQPYILGLVAQSIPFIISGGIMNCFGNERNGANLTTVYASRGNRTAVFFSRQLFHIPNGFAIVVAGLFFSWLLLDMDLSRVNWPVLTLTVLAITISSCAAAALFGNLTIVMNDWVLMYRIFAGVLIVLTGVIIPISSLPAPLAVVSHFLPLTHGLVAFRSAFGGADIQSLLGPLLGEFIVGLGYAILGVVVYHAAEVFAKRRGIVETPA